MEDEDCDQIDVINIDDTGRTTVAGGFVPTVDPDSFFLREPAWSPDGTRIAFAHEATHIDTVTPEGADRVHLDPMPAGFVFSPDWQPMVSATTSRSPAERLQERGEVLQGRARLPRRRCVREEVRQQ